MPYISQPDREELWRGNRSAQTPGELNFMITEILNDYLDRRRIPDRDNRLSVNYAAINDVVGVLQCAQLELYRRIAAPLEDKKCKENGDVYSVA
jgi:hypothetical protein